MVDELFLPLRAPSDYDRESFAAACLLGIVLGAVYDVTRALRRGAGLGKAAENIIDLFYALLFFFCYFVLSVARTGNMRMFTLAGMVIGLAGERCTLGRAVTVVFSQLFKGIRMLIDKTAGRAFAKISQKVHITFVHNKSNFRKFKKKKKKVLKV